MPDPYADLRTIPLQAVLAWLGETGEWRERKGGSELYGPCPICKPKRNKTNFSFTTDGVFRCFSCPAKGKGCIDFLMQYRGVGFQQAVDALKALDIQQELTKHAKKPEVRLQQVPVTENPPFKGTYQKFYVPSEWLAKRGLLPATLTKFEVGQYDNPKRQSAYKGKILLPVRRWKDGELVAFLARDPRPAEERGEDPKYIWPKGFQKSLELFGAFQLKEQAPIRVLYLVESPFSAMHFYQLGFPCVALLGWPVSPQQLDIIAQLAKGVCYLPDSDKRKEAQAYAGLLATRLWVKFPEMPVADPEQLDANQIRALTS